MSHKCAWEDYECYVTMECIDYMYWKPDLADINKMKSYMPSLTFSMEGKMYHANTLDGIQAIKRQTRSNIVRYAHACPGYRHIPPVTDIFDGIDPVTFDPATYFIPDEPPKSVTPYRDRLIALMTEYWNKPVSDYPCITHIDINKDGLINILDVTKVAQMSESDCKVILDAYDVCQAPPAKRTPPCGSYGDLDNDGYVTEADANMIASYTVGNITLTPEQLKRADVDGNGTVDMGDAMRIAQYVAGTIDTFPICEAPPVEAKGKITMCKINGVHCPLVGMCDAGNANSGDEILVECEMGNIGGTTGAFRFYIVDENTSAEIIHIPTTTRHVAPNDLWKPAEFKFVMPSKEFKGRLELRKYE